MDIHLDAQFFITAAAVIAAFISIGVTLAKVHNWYLKIKKTEDNVKSIKEENALITFGVLAALKGLKEQGCNGAVTDAIDKIEKHINIEAHK